MFLKILSKRGNLVSGTPRCQDEPPLYTDVQRRGINVLRYQTRMIVKATPRPAINVLKHICKKCFTLYFKL